MEDTMEITRFCLNPKELRSASVTYETWVAFGSTWVRGAATRVVDPRGRDLGRDRRTQLIDITAAGQRALGVRSVKDAPPPALLVEETNPWEAPTRVRSRDEEDTAVWWEPAVPRRAIPLSSTSSRRRAIELCPYHSMPARAVGG